MTKDRLILGKFGEDLAEKRLRSLGYKILERNYRCSLGEIDLIAKDKDALVFVEIKTRKNMAPAQVKEVVDWRKQTKLSRLALAYMKSNHLSETRARFDVVAIGLNGGKEEVEVVQNAFEFIF